MNGLLPSPRQFFFVQRVFRLLAAPFLDWQVTGLENIPAQGPLLVALNHTSFLDVILPALFFSRPMVSFAKIEAFQLFPLALFLRWMRIIPIRRGAVDRAALERALLVLQEGGAFAIAPEGTRTLNGTLIRAKPGVALLATVSRAPILPMAITGAGAGAFNRNLLHLRRTRIEVTIGPLLQLRRLGATGRPPRQAIADDLMLHIACLLPEGQRGYYASASPESDGYVEPFKAG